MDGVDCRAKSKFPAVRSSCSATSALPEPKGAAASAATCAVPNDPADTWAPPLALPRAVRGNSSTAPPSAPAPNCAPSTPRLTTSRSSSDAGRVARSTAPPPGPCSGMPSSSTSDWSALAPRSENVAACPGPPKACTVTPGAESSSSETERTSPPNRVASTTVLCAAGARCEPAAPTSISTGSPCSSGSCADAPKATRTSGRMCRDGGR